MNNQLALQLEELDQIAAPAEAHFWLGLTVGLSFGAGIAVGALVLT
ncbi:hypothetical protein LJK88_28690 [Paenibacillus sp. P26]|nr:hypothetical protein LJK88_28690 [Paenibacillus sp. P26]UUZ94702.1 hypothetical protein LJK87_09345 [Paenibacillus sp. P25]